MNRSRHVTSKDVAQLAGVSRTTVSLVLNNVPGVNIRPETRQRVLDAARALGYEPNAVAQALVSRRTRAIGLMLTRHPDQIAADAFLPQVVAGMLEVAHFHRLRVLIEIVSPEHQEQEYLRLARAKRIDGIVFSGPQVHDTALKRLEQEGFPTVLMGRLPGSRFCSVDVDNQRAACEAVSYLISLGHRRIACITNAPLSYSAAVDRLAGYRQALEQANIPWDPALVRQGNFDPASGYDQVNDLLESRVSFSAVFVASDTVAMGAKSALRQRGFRIPEDISIVGFDDIIWSRYADPPLTTIHVPAYELGRQASLMLLDILSGRVPQSPTVLLPAHLIERSSCRAVQADEIQLPGERR